MNKLADLEAVVLEHDPDFIVMTETWLKKDILDAEVTPPGYKIVRRDRETRGGGVAVLIRDNILVTVLPHAIDAEALWIKTTLSNRTVYIGAMYRPLNAPVNALDNLRSFMDSVGIERALPFGASFPS